MKNSVVYSILLCAILAFINCSKKSKNTSTTENSPQTLVSSSAVSLPAPPPAAAADVVKGDIASASELLVQQSGQISQNVINEKVEEIKQTIKLEEGAAKVGTGGFPVTTLMLVDETPNEREAAFLAELKQFYTEVKVVTLKSILVSDIKSPSVFIVSYSDKVPSSKISDLVTSGKKVNLLGEANRFSACRVRAPLSQSGLEFKSMSAA